MRVIPILVACALDRDFRNSLNMGIMFFGERAFAAQIGMTLENRADKIWGSLAQASKQSPTPFYTGPTPKTN